MARRPGLSTLNSLAARFHPELSAAPVFSWKWRALVWEAGLRHRSRRPGPAGPYGGFIEVGRHFSVRVRQALGRRKDLGPDSVFFAYDTGALEALEWCRHRGIRTVLNQMDPGRVEVNLVREEEKSWPGWQAETVEVPEEYFQRREQEWALADRVMVNSEFCRDALVKQGVTPHKVVVVPLCYQAAKANTANGNQLPVRAAADGKSSRPCLRVLWLGQVILRKGIQYLLAAAKQLENENIQFDVVGPLGISQSAMAAAPRNVIFHGRATRDQAGGWYRRANLFVLPTLSDGFAITQLEAMSHGLPVIATPCCGAVVSHGVDGFVVPPRDAEALAATLRLYLQDSKLLADHQSAAFAKAGQFTLERLAANLQSLEASL